MTGLCCKTVVVLAAAVSASLLAGCASSNTTTNPPPPGSGIAEYTEITTESMNGVQAALDSLDKVSTQTNHCPPALSEAFSREVQRLQVASMRVRARAQAIQARGDAYFQDWEQTLARVKDPQVRERAERFHPQLQQAFTNLKLASQQTREAFKPFFDGLRKLRRDLENDPGMLETEPARNLVRTTREHGQQVLQKLGSVQNELQAMTRMLRPPASAPNP